MGSGPNSRRVSRRSGIRSSRRPERSPISWSSTRLPFPSLLPQRRGITSPRPTAPSTATPNPSFISVPTTIGGTRRSCRIPAFPTFGGGSSTAGSPCRVGCSCLCRFPSYPPKRIRTRSVSRSPRRSTSSPNSTRGGITRTSSIRRTSWTISTRSSFLLRPVTCTWSIRRICSRPPRRRCSPHRRCSPGGLSLDVSAPQAEHSSTAERTRDESEPHQRYRVEVRRGQLRHVIKRGDVHRPLRKVQQPTEVHDEHGIDHRDPGGASCPWEEADEEEGETGDHENRRQVVQRRDEAVADPTHLRHG